MRRPPDLIPLLEVMGGLPYCRLLAWGQYPIVLIEENLFHARVSTLGTQWRAR